MLVYFTKIASLLRCVNRLSVSSLFGVILVFRLVFAIKLHHKKVLKKQLENTIIPSVRTRFSQLKDLCCDASNHASWRVHMAIVDEHWRKQLLCHRLDFWKCKTQQIKNIFFWHLELRFKNQLYIIVLTDQGEWVYSYSGICAKQLIATHPSEVLV